MASRPPVSIRPATRADLESYLGKVPFTVKAYAAVVEDNVVAIGGIAYTSGVAFGFLDIEEEIRTAYPITLHRMAKKVMKEAMANHKFIFSEQGRTPISRRWLRWLGFDPLNEEETVLICRH